jgi:phage terminase small subunit
MPVPVGDLGPRQQRFVEEYLIDVNAEQAAIRAGYSAKTAEAQGSRLLSNVKVQRAVRPPSRSYTTPWDTIIKSSQVKIGGNNKHGYRRANFTKACSSTDKARP